MSGFEDFISQYSEQFTIFISILIALYGFYKWLTKANKKAVNELRKELLGDKEAGTIGIIGRLEKEHEEDVKDIQNDFKNDLANMRKDFMNEIKSYQSDLISQHKQSIQEIRYIKRDLNRIERSLEKLTGGYYTVAKTETDRQEYDNDIKDNHY